MITDGKMKLFIFVLVSYTFFESVSSTCSFPNRLVGTWENPSQGNLTFNSTHLSGYDVAAYTDLDFECHMSSDDRYILRSSDFTLLGLSNVVNAAFCILLTKQSNNKFTYFILTDELADADNQRVTFIQSSHVIASMDEICNDPTVNETAPETKLLVKSGQAGSEVIQCPDDILGTYWYYNHTTCNETSYWDVCEDLTQMTFNYTQCSEQQAYSAEGRVRCLYSTEGASDTVIYMYNNDSTVDNSATYRYSCMVIRKRFSDLVYVTQYPNDCLTNQTSTYVLSPGQSIILSPNVPTNSSATSATSVSNAGLVAGLSVMFIVLLGVGGAVVGYYIYTKKFKKVEPNDKKVIDRENAFVSDNRQLDAVTPSVVNADVTSPRNGGSHGKITQLLGPEYTMTNACDDDKAHSSNEGPTLEEPSPRKLPAITTGDTPREALSPLDTQLKRPQLPPIP